MCEELSPSELSHIERQLQLIDEDTTKWIVIERDLSEEKYKTMISEIEELRSIVLEMNRLVFSQQETMNSVDSNILKVAENFKKIDNELIAIKNGSSNKLAYVRDYLIPGTFALIGFLGLQTPILLFLGVKFGVVTSALHFLFYKLF